MNNLKLGFNILGKYMVCVIMCFFITFSFVAIFSMATIEMVGYDAAVFENKDAEEPIEEYKHYYSDGNDAKKAEYESKGNIVVTRQFAGDFEGAPYIVCHIVSQIVSLVFFVIIVPYSLYKQGKLDANAVSCGRMEEDKLRGLKAGLMPAAASLIGWVFLVLAKLGIYKPGLQIYAFVNYHLYGYQKMIFGHESSIVVTDIDWAVIAWALLPVVLTLALCAITYLLGYKDMNLYEKAVYKKS